MHIPKHMSKLSAWNDRIILIKYLEEDIESEEEETKYTHCTTTDDGFVDVTQTIIHENMLRSFK